MGGGLDEFHQRISFRQFPVLVREGQPVRQKLIQHDSHRIDVRLRAELIPAPGEDFRRRERNGHWLASGLGWKVWSERVIAIRSNLLRCEVDERLLDAVARFGQHAGRTPVNDPHVPELADHDVGGLQVAMNDPLVVGLGHDLRDTNQHFKRLPQRPVRVRFLHGLPHLSERRTGKQIGRVERLAVQIQAQIVNGKNARMLELTGYLGFSDKSVAGGGRFQHLVTQSLHRQSAAELKIPNFPDLSLTAPANAPQNLVFVKKIPPRLQPGGDAGPVRLVSLRWSGCRSATGFKGICQQAGRAEVQPVLRLSFAPAILA